jgi:general secretion pathway protein D
MQDTVTDTEDKVPILGDMPLLGYLFKYTSKTKHKTNLIVMLTPYIIKDQLDLEQIRQRKLRQNDEFFRSMVRLDSMAFAPGQDYRRKRGLLEEINRAVLEVDAERAVHAEAAAPAGVPTGRVEIPDEPAAP